MDTMVSLVVKVLWKLISLICFRVYLEVNVHKNPTCFSRWSVREYIKDDIRVYSIEKLLSEWNGIEGISLTIKQDNELPSEENN